MKNVQKLFLALVVFGGIMLASCNNSSSAADETEMSQEQGKEFTSKYICPMHCEGSGSEEPGICPVCEMDYVLNENHESYTEEAHDHDTHSHDEHIDHEEGHEETHDGESHEGHEH